MQDSNPNSTFGADINQFKSGVNFELLARTVDFLYLRSSGSGSGAFKVDTKFLEFAKGARMYGIPVGAYHYALPSEDLSTADQQADDFIDVLQQAFGPNDYGDIFPVLDVEAPVNKSITTPQLLTWIDRFRKRFERKTRRKLMLYTGNFFIDIYDNFLYPGKGYILSDMPLWIAMYKEIQGNPPYPKDQGGWTRWTIWQFTENGRINGVDPPVDLNYGPDNIDYLTPPRNVEGLKAYFDQNNLYILWSRNPDVDLLGYNLFINGEYLATPGRKATSYKVPLWKLHIPKGESLEIGAEAFDFAGDFSLNRTKITIRRTREEMRTDELKGIYISYPDEYLLPFE